MEEIIGEEKAHIIIDQGYEFIKDKKYKEALTCFKRARRAISKIYSEMHEDVVMCYNMQAFCYQHLQRTDASFVYYALTYLIAKKTCDYNLSEIKFAFSTVSQQLADIIEQNMNTDNEELRDHFKALIEIASLNNYDEEANLCYSMMAKMSEREGDYSQAIEYLNLAIDNLQNYDSLNQIEIAKCLERRGNMYTMSNKLDDALDSYNKEAYYLAQKYEEDSQEYLDSQIAILRTFIYLNKMNEAEKLQDKIFKILKTKYLDSILTLNKALEIADTYFDIKVYDKATKAYLDAIECVKLIFKDQPSEIDNLINFIKEKFSSNGLVFEI